MTDEVSADASRKAQAVYADATARKSRGCLTA
jgi:hypothetical protein